MRIGQTFATEVGHGVRLAPHHVIQNPEPLVLKFGTHPKHVVVTADYPDCTVRLKQTARRCQPITGELVIGRKGRKLVPVIINGIDFGVIGAMKIATKLEIVGRVRKNEVHAICGKRIHYFNAIARKNTIQRERCRALLFCSDHFTASYNRRIFPLYGWP